MPDPRKVNKFKEAFGKGLKGDVKKAARGVAALEGPGSRAAPGSDKNARALALDARLTAMRQAKADLQALLTKANTLGSAQANTITAEIAKLDAEMKFARVDAPDPFRAALVQKQVRIALGAIDTKITQHGVDASDPAGPTLVEKLGSKLNRILDDMLSDAVLVALKEDGKLAGPNAKGKSYAKAMEELLANDGALLHQRFPGLKAKIDLETQQFQQNMGELVDSFVRDRADLQNTFFGGTPMQGISDLIVTESDPHNGGRRVTVLACKGTDGSEHRVVNKPRDVRMDAKLVGGPGSASEKFSEILVDRELKKLRDAEYLKRAKAILGRELKMLPDDDTILRTQPQQLGAMVWNSVNQHALQDLWTEVHAAVPRSAAQVPPLPTYGYLAKGGQNPNDHPYGWVEFVEHGSDADRKMNPQEAKAFYRQCGRQAAMTMLFGVEDVHQGNLMVSGKQPQLTDLEIAFKTNAMPIAKAFDAWKADPTRVNFADVLKPIMFDKALTDFAENKYVESTKVENDRIHEVTMDQSKGIGVDLAGSPTMSEPSDNIVDVGPLPQGVKPVAAHGADLLQGMLEMFEALKDPAASREIENLIDGFAGVHVRHHVVPTRDQLMARRRAQREGFAGDGADLATMKKEAEGMTKSQSAQSGNPKCEALADIVAADLDRRDVAYFTRELGTGKLLHNGTDEMKDGNDDYFDDDPIAVAKKQLATLRSDEGQRFAQAMAQAFAAHIDRLSKPKTLG